MVAIAGGVSGRVLKRPVGAGAPYARAGRLSIRRWLDRIQTGARRWPGRTTGEFYPPGGVRAPWQENAVVEVFAPYGISGRVRS